MTPFTVSRDAVVSEKYLGRITASIAGAMRAFDPYATSTKCFVVD